MSTQSQFRFGKNLDKIKIADITALISNKIQESLNLEYKQPSQNLDQDSNFLAERLSGFLNTNGGILVYGIAEKKEKNHFHPTEIKWCKFNKERLENLLKSKIQPWNEKIKIRRIEKENDNENGIYVIEVPKSENPPHMCNNIYYQRLNYQTKPMSHWNVSRIFQTSWIRRKEFRQKILEPLYSEIKLDFERIEKFEQGNVGKYRHITTENIYLFDQIEPSLRKLIEDFFMILKEYNVNVGRSEKTARWIINNQLSKIFTKRKDWFEQRSAEDPLFLSVKIKEPSGKISDRRPQIGKALLLKKSPEEYLKLIYKDDQILNFEPYINTSIRQPFSRDLFDKFWANCNNDALVNQVFLSVWEAVPKLKEIGKMVLSHIQTY